MFGVIKRMSHRKLLRQNKNRSLNLNILIVSDIQLFLRKGKDSKPWNTHPLQEKTRRHFMSVYDGRQLLLSTMRFCNGLFGIASFKLAARDGKMNNSVLQTIKNI